jgi:hypothetical protein
VQVFDANRVSDAAQGIFSGRGQFARRLAVHVASSEWATEKEGAETGWPMVSTVRDIDLRSSAKLTAAHDDRGVQKIPIDQQADESIDRAVEDRTTT